MVPALKELTVQGPASVNAVIKVQTENLGSMKEGGSSEGAQNSCTIKL